MNTDHTTADQPDEKEVFTIDDYWRIVLNGYENDGDLPYGDEQRRQAMNKHVEALLRRHVLTARIEEIEDIDQSRDIQVEDDGDYIWCMSCHMILEDREQDCACNILYQKRKDRLAALRDEQAGLEGEK